MGRALTARGALCALVASTASLACSGGAQPSKVATASQVGAGLPTLAVIDRSSPCEVNEASKSPLRTLSNVEYFNTLQDLFPTADLSHLAASLDEPGALDPVIPSPLIVDRYLRTATQLGALALPRARELTGCDPAQSQACAEAFVPAFGSRAFRRPLDVAETRRFIGLLREQSAKFGVERALRDTLIAFILAPQFMYRLDWAAPPKPAPGSKSKPSLDAYALANRLSYHFWQTMPDDALFEAASTGQLQTEAGYQAQVRRLLASPKAGKAFGRLVSSWFELGQVLHEVKAARLTAWKSESGRSALRESQLFADYVFTSKQPTLRALLTSNHAIVDDAMAAVYGVQGTGSWHPVELEPTQRAGLLTRAAFLAGRARSTASPPLRGSLLMRRLLCEPVPSPPANVNNTTPVPVKGAPPSTNRQRFERAIAEGAECGGCHASMDPLGYAFENYDAIGQYQTAESGIPIDATADFSWLDLARDVNGGVELSKQLATSPSVGYCAVTTLYRYAFQTQFVAAQWCKIDPIYQAFEREDGDLRVAMAALATSPAFRRR